MQKGITVLLLALASGWITASANAHIHAFDASRQDRLLARLVEVDFEDVNVYANPNPFPLPGLPNPLILDGVTFTDPHRLSGGFCSSPTCEPDPDNADDGNNGLFLNPGATIKFEKNPALVVMDIQGNGDNPFTLAITDARGHRQLVRSQGVPFGKTVIGIYSLHRIAQIKVVEVGGTGGPLAVSRVLYSRTRR